MNGGMVGEPAELGRIVGEEAAEESAAAECRACGAAGLHAFYLVEGVPSQSCVLLDTRQEAEGYPRGDVLLGFCEACGFIENVRFDPDRVDYAQPTEESQAFSAEFNRFAEELAAELVDRYRLVGKGVLEVGSGKGDFLLLLAGLGVGSAVGIDPGYGGERVPGEASSKVAFIRDFYTHEHVGLTGDLVLTRHTLEHIAPVGEFLSRMAASARRTPGSAVFHEVPDARRVLEERAFWDVYYEHCSYFTAGSLARAVRAAGMGVEEVRLGFDDQYLLCFGSGVGGGRPLPIEEDPAELAPLVVSFAREASSRVEGWRRRVRAEAAKGPVALWGGGSKAIAFLTTLGIDDEVAAVVDINPYKQGTYLAGTGQRVVAPEALTEIGPELVIVMNPVYEDEIRRHLGSLGLSPRVVSV